jgi:hypothetical protein
MNSSPAASPARWAQMSAAIHSIIMRKYLIFLFLTLTGFNSVSGQNNSPLPDGTYIIEPDSLFRFYPKSRYEIAKNKCYIVENGKKYEYDFIGFGKHQFRLKSNALIDTTNFTPLQKYLNSRQPFFDIYKVDGDYYYFVNRVDLHVRIYSGRFVKIKE